MRDFSIALAASALIGAGTAWAAPMEVVTNGGFESGDTTGWTIGGGGGGSCNTNWTVGSTGTATGCTSLPDPDYGTYAAYNSLVADGPRTYRLEQVVTIPSGGAIVLAELRFATIFEFVLSGSATDHTFTVSIDGTPVPLVTPSVFGTGTSGHSGQGEDPVNPLWLAQLFDVSSLVAPGATVTLAFEMYAPDASGLGNSGGLGLDAVSLLVDVVPEPGTLSLVAFGVIGFGAAAGRRRRAA